MPYKNIEIERTNFNPNHTSKHSQWYKGFSTVDSSNKNSKLFDYELVKQDLLNRFNTRKGQRVMDPNFGTIVWDLIMEPMTEETKNLLLNDITENCKADSRAYPLQIEVNEFEQGYLVEVTLLFRETNQTELLKLMFDQKIGLRAV